jgi:hypothetical protein
MSKASNLAGFVTSISPPSDLNVGIVTATQFIGDLTGTASTATSAGTAATSILAGTAATSILSGTAATSILAGTAYGLTGSPNITVGVVTATNATIGTATTFTEDLVVQGDARVTGILTVGTSSITLDGSNNEIRVGSGVTLSSSTGLSGSGANLTSLNASNLSSGTLPDARFPATLPSASGANLTSLNASNLSSGTVATARLGSGSASSANFLRGDQTWAEAGGGAWEFITSATGSSASSIAITSGIDSTYDRYALTFHFVSNLTGGNESYLYMKYSSNGGSSWLSGNYYRGEAFFEQPFTGTTGVLSFSGSRTESLHTEIRPASRFNSSGYIAGTVELSKPSVSSQALSYYNIFSSKGSELYSSRGVGMYSSSTTVNAIQFYPSSGTITGTVRLYGLKNS